MTREFDRSLDIASRFNATSATYDAARAKLVPCFARFYETAVSLLAFKSTDAIAVLDLGAGTGLLSAWIMEAFPQAELTLMDLAATMLDHAKLRLAGCAKPPKILVRDYVREPLGGPYDAIVSALSIHHCDDAHKQELFKRIYAALRTGGIFVNAEQVAAPTPELDAAYECTWHKEIRAAGATDEELAAAATRMQADRCTPLDVQLAWLRDAGFGEVDCRFKDGRFAVYSGRKLRDR